MSTADRDPIYIGLNDRLGTRLKSYKGAWDKKGSITIVIEVDDPGDYGYVLSRLQAAEAALKRPAKKGGAE